LNKKRVAMTLRLDLLYPSTDPRVYKEAKSLVNKGYDVTVVCWMHKDAGHPIREDYEGIHILRVPHSMPPGSTSRMARAPGYIELLGSMQKAIRSIRPHLVHSHDTDTLLEGWAASRSLRVPLIFDSHEDYPAMVQPILPLLSKVTTLEERLLVPGADHIIAATEGIGDKFRKMGVPVTVVYNARPEEDLPQVDSAGLDTLRKRFTLSEDDFVVGFIGMVSSTRGLDVLIRSLPLTEDRGIKALIVGGPKEYVEELKDVATDEKVSERVILSGPVPYKEVMNYYRLMDVGVVLFQPLPNHFVTAPNKLFEYMSCHIPMLMSDFPEYRRILKDELEAALFCDPEDPKDVARAINRLRSDPQLVKRITKNATRLEELHYTWEIQAEKLLKVYESLL